MSKVQDEIFRSKTALQIDTTENADDIAYIQRSNTFDFEDMVKTGETDTVKKTGKAKAGIKDVKKKAEKLPVKVPKVKSELDIAKDRIRELHLELEAEENNLPGNYSAVINRKRYSDLSESDIKKRAQKALEREKNAGKIKEYENGQADEEPEYSHIDRETLKKKIEAFKKLPSDPLDMDTDEKFVANLAENYKLCKAADLMKHWIEEASDNGFLPQDEDIEAIEEKIVRYGEIKKYLDTQKSLMKNPYYKYMAKADVSYTADDLEKLSKGTANETIRSYIKDVMTLRELHFVRSKGMKSLKDHARKQGKHEAEALATRNQKKDIVSRLSEGVLNIKGNKRFTDKDYDKRFTEELFKKRIDDLKKLDIKSIHFSGLKDITDHMDDNQFIFDQVHDAEHLLFVALQRGIKVSDDELIDLRAKIESVTMIERMVSAVRLEVISKADSFIQNDTFKDAENRVFNSIKQKIKPTGRPIPPEIGSDLEKYLKNVKKQFKKEHKNRKDSIKMMYGISHVTMDEEGNYECGVISDEELAGRMAEYQKNAFCSDYARNCEVYIQDIYGCTLDAINELWSKKTGNNRIIFGRTLAPYLTGKSSGEIIEVINIMQTGTESEKENLWKSIANEVFDQFDIGNSDSMDRGIFFKDFAARIRRDKLIANLSGSTNDFDKYIKDREFRKKCAVVYNFGCSNNYGSAYAQAANGTDMNALFFEDWSVKNPELSSDFLKEIDDDEAETISFKVGEKDYEIDKNRFDYIQKCCDRVGFMHASGLSAYKPERAKKGIRNSSYVAYYEEIKHQGIVKSVTEKEQKQLADFYKKSEEQRNKTADALLAETVKEIKKTDNSIKRGSKDKFAFVNDMFILNRNKEGKEKRGENGFTEAEINRSAFLYKALVKDSEKNDAVSRQNRAEAIEEIMRTIMSFDISRFNFASYMDIIKTKKEDPGRFEECRAVSRLAAEAVRFADIYRDLRMDEDVRCLLREAHVDEFKARCELLRSANSFFNDRFVNILSSGTNNESGLSIDEALHLTPYEISDKLAKANEKRDLKAINFWVDVKDMIASLEGFDITVPLKTMEDNFRAKRGLLGVSRAEEIVNILNKKESVLKDIRQKKINFTFTSEYDFMTRFATEFEERDLTVSEREKKLFNKKSRLFEKRVISERILNKSNFTRDDILSEKKKISIENRVLIGEENAEYLSPFLEGEKEQINLIVAMFADKKTREDALDILTEDIMETDININVVNDEDFAKNAGMLEMISKKAIAYDALLKANPGYKKKLLNRVPGNALSDLERVERRLDRMFAISDYYRAKKLLLTDPHYILHYNEEITRDRDRAVTEDQKRVAGLIGLVSVCTRRLADEDFRSRDEADLDRILENAERVSRQNAYLTGRPDLSKADPDRTEKEHDEIRRYFSECGINVSTKVTDIAEKDPEEPYPEAEKYKTEAAKNYFSAVHTYGCLKINSDESLKKLYTPEKNELRRKINELLKDGEGTTIHKIEYYDKETGNTFAIPTDMQRIAIEVIGNYGGTMSDEEILDVFEGLTLRYRTTLDMSKDENAKYVKDRFFASVTKLFRMELENMKRFENTYGNLGHELPYGVFFSVIGSGFKEFVIRNRFGQDMANLCDEGDKDSLIDGEKMTLSEALYKNGYITREEADYAHDMGPEYTQNFQLFHNNFIQTTDAFGEDPDGEVLKRDIYLPKEIEGQQFAAEKINIGGPKLSKNRLRDIWKKSGKYKGEYLITGGDRFLKFQKNKYDAFTASEKKALKDQRSKDRSIIHFYDAYIEDKKEMLLKETTRVLGEGFLSPYILKKLIVFHPGLLNGKKNKNKQDEDTGKFYDNLRLFAGSAEEKKKAMYNFIEVWGKTFKAFSLVYDPEDMMTSGEEINGRYLNARENPDDIEEGSVLYQSEVRHMMYESVKDLTSGDGSDMYLTEESKKILKERGKTQFSQEIQRTLLRSDFYKNLKDIGGRKNTYQERMYEEMKHFSYLLREGHFDLIKTLKEKNMSEALKEFGMSEDELLNIYKDEIEAYEEERLNNELKELEKELTREEIDAADIGDEA